MSLIDQKIKEERATRVRLLRRMTGLSREAFAIRHHIAASNFQNWEKPRFGGLTEKGAGKLVEAFDKEGVKTSVEWLMYGHDAAPAFLYATQPFAAAQPADAQVGDISGIYTVAPTLTPFTPRVELPLQLKNELELVKIAREMELFKKNHADNILMMVVIDELMSPCYKLGDYVAGQRYTAITPFIGYDCIIESSKKELLLRKLAAKNDENNSYTFTGMSIDCKRLTLKSEEIVSVAPVMWIRRGM